MAIITVGSRPVWSLIDSVLADPMGMNGGRLAYNERYPLVNVWTSEEQVVVEAEVPGVDPKQIEITLKDDALTIEGKRTADELREGDLMQRKERFEGAFSRTLILPYRGEAGAVVASCRNGVLRVVVPRSQAEKPHKVKIESE